LAEAILAEALNPVQLREGLEYMYFSLDRSLSRDKSREGAIDAQHVETLEFCFFVEYSHQRRDAEAAVSLPQGPVHKNAMSVHSILLEVFEKYSQ